MSTSRKIGEATPEAAMQPQAVALPQSCLTDKLICFASWACFFLHNSACLSLWQRLSFVSKLLWLISILACEFQSGLAFLIGDEWLWSCSMAFIFLLLEVFLKRWMWYLHSCPAEVISDVRDGWFWDFLHSSHKVCHQLVLFTLVNLFDVWLLVYSFSPPGHS